MADGDNLSGAAWFDANQARYPNSNRVEDLEETFQVNVNGFLGALRTAGASISIASTLRNADRAFLMHYSWRVANGEISAADVPARAGVDIVWDHGDDALSRAAANEMVQRFAISYKPSLTSRHIEGKAIDMNITWTDTITVRKNDGTEVQVTFMDDVDQNTTLHEVGASYGVIKFVSQNGHPDRPHWSTDGH